MNLQGHINQIIIVIFWIEASYNRSSHFLLYLWSKEGKDSLFSTCIPICTLHVVWVGVRKVSLLFWFSLIGSRLLSQQQRDGRFSNIVFAFVTRWFQLIHRFDFLRKTFPFFRICKSMVVCKSRLFLQTFSRNYKQ